MFKSVLLYTNKLKTLKRFYRDIIGLNLSNSSDEAFTAEIGDSKITFVQTTQPVFYHFAINIAGNQFSMMKYWLQNRVKLNRDEGRDQVYFPAFDADSMYFEDPAGNMVELIGRRHRDLFGDLSPASFLNVSEVGVVTPYVTDVGEELQDFGIALRNGTEVDPAGLNFLGKEDTFIVLVPPNRRWYFSKEKSETHPLEITLQDGSHLILDDQGRISITEVSEGE